MLKLHPRIRAGNINKIDYPAGKPAFNQQLHYHISCIDLCIGRFQTTVLPIMAGAVGKFPEIAKTKIEWC